MVFSDAKRRRGGGGGWGRVGWDGGGKEEGCGWGYRGGCEKQTGRADHSTKVEWRKIQLRGDKYPDSAARLGEEADRAVRSARRQTLQMCLRFTAELPHPDY